MISQKDDNVVETRRHEDVSVSKCESRANANHFANTRTAQRSLHYTHLLSRVRLKRRVPRLLELRRALGFVKYMLNKCMGLGGCNVHELFFEILFYFIFFLWII